MNYLKDIRRAADVTQHGLVATSSTPAVGNKPVLPSAPVAPPSRPKRPVTSELTQQLKEYLNSLRAKKEFKIFLTPVLYTCFQFLTPLGSRSDCGRIHKRTISAKDKNAYGSQYNRQTNQ